MGIGDIPPLPDLIKAQAQQLNLDGSWQDT
jgi:hypothetical protein